MLYRLPAFRQVPHAFWSGLEVSPEAVRALPTEFVKRHLVMPLQIRDGTLFIATSAAGNQRVLEDIRLLTGLEVEECLAPAADIAEKIAESYQVTVEKMLQSSAPGERCKRREARPLHDIEVMANEPDGGEPGQCDRL